MGDKMMKQVDKEITKISSFFLKSGPLRFVNYVIGYALLISTVFDLLAHLVIVGLISNGYVCETTKQIVYTGIKWDYVDPLFLMLNIGTHGIYPLSALFRYTKYTLFEYYKERPLKLIPKCYENTLHIYNVDFLELILSLVYITLIWLYLDAIKKKKLSTLWSFFYVSLFKWILYLMFITYSPYWEETMVWNVFLVLKIMDPLLIGLGLIVIYAYAHDLQKEKDDEPVLVRRIYRRRIVPHGFFTRRHLQPEQPQEQLRQQLQQHLQTDEETPQVEKERDTVILSVDTDNLNAEEPHNSGKEMKEITYL